jgi:hypothetical protein
VIFRFIFGRLFGITVKSKVYTYGQQRQQNPHKKEGEIRIDTKQTKSSGNSSNLGEYVDYEEIK